MPCSRDLNGPYTHLNTQGRHLYLFLPLPTGTADVLQMYAVGHKVWDGSHRIRIVSVIFRMIYCCGLRPVEARRLRREDVNLFDGTVNILESKGHKDRIVVLSEDMRELCRNYDQRVEAIHPERRYFFQSPSVRGDGMYSMEWIIPTFRKFLQTAGIISG